MQVYARDRGDLQYRIGELPGGELWVHCQAGYRASVAASFLDAADRTVVAIDDDYDRAAKAGLPVVTPAAAMSHAGRGM